MNKKELILMIVAIVILAWVGIISPIIMNNMCSASETSYQEVSINVIQNNKVITSYIGALENKDNKIVILPLTKEGYIIVIEEIDAKKLFTPQPITQPKPPAKIIKEKEVIPETK